MIFSHLWCSSRLFSIYQGRRARFARSCPWLSYFAPSALELSGNSYFALGVGHAVEFFPPSLVLLFIDPTDGVGYTAAPIAA